MGGILDYSGLVGAFVLSLLIIVPIIVRSLRLQNAQLKGEEGVGAPGPPPPLIALECPSCGQTNRVPLEAERALCGHCKSELRLESGAATG